MKPLPERVPSRVVIEGVEPEIDAGRFAVKRTVGEGITIAADVFTDGHDALAAVVRHRPAGEAWTEVVMVQQGNDRWTASFALTAPGWHEYTVQAWLDWFATWRRDLGKKADAGLDVTSELLEIAELIRRTAAWAGGADGAWLRGQADALDREDAGQDGRVRAVLDPALAAVMARHADRSLGHRYERTLRIWVDHPRARFSTWYELFPRSTADEPGDVEQFARLLRPAALAQAVPPAGAGGQPGLRGRPLPD
jgi:starch synthase (maltosyl-transferring)